MAYVIVLLLILVGLLCFRLATTHGRLSRSYQLVANMLNAGDMTDVNELAKAEMHRMKTRKWWQA